MELVYSYALDTAAQSRGVYTKTEWIAAKAFCVAAKRGSQIMHVKSGILQHSKKHHHRTTVANSSTTTRTTTNNGLLIPDFLSRFCTCVLLLTCQLL